MLLGDERGTIGIAREESERRCWIGEIGPAEAHVVQPVVAHDRTVALRLAAKSRLGAGTVVVMARLPIVDPSATDADPAAVLALRQVSGRSGRSVPRNVWATMANHPQALATVAELARVVYVENSMTPAQRELAYLGASVTNDCHY
jgi:hypothetical protein